MIYVDMMYSDQVCDWCIIIIMNIRVCLKEKVLKLSRGRGWVQHPAAHVSFAGWWKKCLPSIFQRFIVVPSPPSSLFVPPRPPAAPPAPAPKLSSSSSTSFHSNTAPSLLTVYA